MEKRTVKTITVPAGKVARKYEQTASRDHNVDLIPGTYPVTYTLGYILWAGVPAIAHDHTASTVEFGGVALASEQRGGEQETYSLNLYDYEIPRYEEAGYIFGY